MKITKTVDKCASSSLKLKMHVRGVLVCLFAGLLFASAQHTGADHAEIAVETPILNVSTYRCPTFAGSATRLLAQDTIALEFNVTLGSVSIITADQAEDIETALTKSLAPHQTKGIVVSSNTIVQDNQLTLIILVYPSSNADTAALQSDLEELAAGTKFAANLKDSGIPVSTVTINSVKPQITNQGAERAPVSGSSLAGAYRRSKLLIIVCFRSWTRLVSIGSAFQLRMSIGVCTSNSSLSEWTHQGCIDLQNEWFLLQAFWLSLLLESYL